MPNYQWPSVPEPAARGLQLVRGLAAPLFVLFRSAPPRRAARQQQAAVRSWYLWRIH